MLPFEVVPLIDWLLYGQMPDTAAVAGVAMIVVSSLCS